MGIVNGVERYAHGIVRVDAWFPNGDVCCYYCPLLKDEREGLKRWICAATRELVFTPNNGVGRLCPIRIIQEGGEE